MELHKRDLHSIAHASTLSATARSFRPTATSSEIVTGAPVNPVAPEEPTRPLYSSEEEGAVTDVSNCSRQSHRCGARRRAGHETDGSETDYSGASSAPGTNGFRKKTGITNRVELPKFGGKKGHPHDVVNAFRWHPSLETC